ncbi:hypothetical protein QN357_01560 [Cryobacterium sp. RTC2.1]|uniref:hypothetical protein n=1 Tax=Cryobacterium sp. RTC2.1 TaxID=3048634 RepID=UPI002B23CF63|nr:hypothetical protein [Cryobacterium sp. RTC2.1]MEB0001623.1 hypothetical protein [Cryobacterium sp. RTC2.1]
MTTYVETVADQAFTAWLSGLDAERVERERHAHLTPVERRMLAYQSRRKPAAAPPPEQLSESTQFRIALAVLAALEPKAGTTHGK